MHLQDHSQQKSKTRNNLGSINILISLLRTNIENNVMKLNILSYIYIYRGTLNYVINFYTKLSQLCKPLHDQLKKNTK